MGRDVAYATGWGVVRLLPSPVADTLFAVGADVAARRAGPRARQLRCNLARVVPQAGPNELDELTRKALRSYGRYWQEIFRLPAVDRDEICRKVDAGIDGVDNLTAALADGRGAVLALPHSGNWDVAGLWLANRVGRFTTVAERLRPESLYRRFVRFRESLGFEILPLASVASYRTLRERLRANRVVCLVADRDLTAAGIDVTFFGERTRMPGGPARLAADTGAALLPVGSWFTDSGWGFRVHPRIRVDSRDEVAAATQLLADCFAGDIAAHPADWHMLQRLWLADLDDPDAIPPVGGREVAAGDGGDGQQAAGHSRETAGRADLDEPHVGEPGPP
ncbi:phosphatidylinositol mannoside acyltransferase [Haloechinothrix sp. LS1_15]|uniref:phosphatidylinositol mannoside acyltransferase n=1 Tax=Haloechinothrix sp. LS1_15 TaxID=2652248 RepID=UPI0029449D7F|nr:phosphatidylinositol mannoside acyltransferase [Haloechinothrix sp. LS1_15]MDV6013334.1 phosphatidylinositol mannoside acyltransferase [Haloechinothrix sp. LS1_15]